MMNLNPGSVSQTQAVLDAYEKDPGFKKSLAELEKALSAKKLTDQQVAEQESRLKKAGDEANRKEIEALKAIEALASKEGEIDRRESEFELARSAFNEAMADKQRDFGLADRVLKQETARLQELDGHLKQLQGEIQQKEADLKAEREKFEAWRAKLLSMATVEA